MKQRSIAALGLLVVFVISAGYLVGRLPPATVTELASIAVQLPPTYLNGRDGRESAVDWGPAVDSTGVCDPYDSATTAWTGDGGGNLGHPAMILDVCATPAPALAAYLDLGLSAVDVAPQRMRDLYAPVAVAASDLPRLHADAAAVDCLLVQKEGCSLWVFRARYGQYWLALLWHDIAYSGTLPVNSFVKVIQSYDENLFKTLRD